MEKYIEDLLKQRKDDNKRHDNDINKEKDKYMQLEKLYKKLQTEKEHIDNKLISFHD